MCVMTPMEVLQQKGVPAATSNTDDAVATVKTLGTTVFFLESWLSCGTLHFFVVCLLLCMPVPDAITFVYFRPVAV